MKKLKQIILDVKTRVAESNPDEMNDLLWPLICYPPKMPLRLQQEQLLADAEKFSVMVEDPYFTNKQLNINAFKWGKGKHRVLITHGWGSKALDFDGLITALLTNPNLQVIAFDAPACGSSDGELSNLLLFVNAAKAVIAATGAPDVAIGHSFGAMANVVALTALNIKPALLISIAPFILLQENFIKNMTAAGVSPQAQQNFLEDFKARYGIYPSQYNMPDLYTFNEQLNHWLAYDAVDQMLPDAYLQDFLKAHPSIKTKNYNGAGHERIIKSAELIGDVVELINQTLAGE
jgi:pimeloyl-ACP methyl ester carboxylesterase